MTEPAASAQEYQYDFAVIGGGSGGLAASKAAAVLGARTVVFDFVKPSPLGTTWGLGGTCVNVGCIPKKLMHQAALLHRAMKDAPSYGWEVPEGLKFNWETLVQSVQNHIGSLNWGYRVALRDKSVEYQNSYATFVDKHTLKTVNKRGKESIFTAKYILVATGGRPKYPDIPGAKEFCITSDDLFSLPKAPGKTLVVGASYIALECGGFLNGVGYDTTVMVRSIFLRGFDQQMAEKVAGYMATEGVKFIRDSVPTKVEKNEDGTLLVTYDSPEGPKQDTFDTVLFAVGRDPCTTELEIAKAGVALDPKSGKIITNDADQTNVPNIFAIGDVLLNKPELTPVAIQAGKLLASRLFDNKDELCDYVNVCTTVFTPLEYGCCGYAEEKAIEIYGQDNIEVYHSAFTPLEFTVVHRDDNVCYAKLICLKTENMKVIGFHIFGPNAGEITQGFGIAFRLGATYQDFSQLIGIHPTCAETFTTLNITKASGQDVNATGC